MIPDAVSATQLATLIGQAHLSPRIPSVRCGPVLDGDRGYCGGPFDLAFLFDQLMRKSTSLNAVQITCAIGYVLNELICYFDHQIESIESRQGSFISLPDDLSDEAIDKAAAAIASDRDALTGAARLVEGVLDRMLEHYAFARMQCIDPLIDDQTHEREFHSIFAISDELLDDLGLSRQQVDSFIS